jgi:hypothetical protein
VAGQDKYAVMVDVRPQLTRSSKLRLAIVLAIARLTQGVATGGTQVALMDSQSHTKLISRTIARAIMMVWTLIVLIST